MVVLSTDAVAEGWGVRLRDATKDAVASDAVTVAVTSADSDDDSGCECVVVLSIEGVAEG